jgi:hypothetical protein
MNPAPARSPCATTKPLGQLRSFYGNRSHLRTSEDFRGLYFRKCTPEDEGYCFTLPELEAIDSGIDSVSRIGEIFARLESRGTHIPAAYSLTTNGDGPKRVWKKILNDIGWDYHELHSIVRAMLDERTRDLDSVCCG